MAQTPEGAAKIAAAKAGIAVGEYLTRRAAGLKRCTDCKEWHPVAMFGKDTSRGDGLAAAGQCCRRVKVRVSRRGMPSAFKGKTHSHEARAKISAAHAGPAKREERRPAQPGRPREDQHRGAGSCSPW